MLKQRLMRQRIHCSGHHCTLGQRHQEEVVHPMIQEAAAVKVRMDNKVKVEVHPQEEEEPQEIQAQEEEHALREVGSQEVTIPRATPHHSRQEEQAFQAVIHKHLQG